MVRKEFKKLAEPILEENEVKKQKL